MKGNLWIDGKLVEANIEFTLIPGQTQSQTTNFLGGGFDVSPVAKDPDIVRFRTTFGLKTMQVICEMEINGLKTTISLQGGQSNSYWGYVS